MIMSESTSNDTTQVTSFTVTLEEDGDDIVMPIPEDILKSLDWNEGDLLEWDINDKDNTIILRKAQ
jgi:bifunctional DNA-binding transcriptional regulator/antitoxin component of YhaV-PrlF toxin-antitoxin module